MKYYLAPSRVLSHLIPDMQMREQDLMRLDEVCRKYQVPLLIARSYGLVGYLRVSGMHSADL